MFRSLLIFVAALAGAALGDSLRLSDLKRRHFEPDVNGFNPRTDHGDLSSDCVCSEEGNNKNCGCCVKQDIPFLGAQNVCTKFFFDPGLWLKAELSLNDDTIIRERIYLGEPICANFGVGKFCLNVETTVENGVSSLCARASFKVLDPDLRHPRLVKYTELWKHNFDCQEIPSQLSAPARYGDAVGLGPEWGCYKPNGDMSAECGLCITSDTEFPYMGKPAICTNFTFDPLGGELTVEVILNERIIIKKGVDLGEPQDICQDVVAGRLCIRIDSSIGKEGFHVCTKVYLEVGASIWAVKLWEEDLGCHDIPLQLAGEWSCRTDGERITRCVSVCNGVHGKTESIRGQEGAVYMEYDALAGMMRIAAVEVRENAFYYNDCQVGARPSIENIHHSEM